MTNMFMFFLTLVEITSVEWLWVGIVLWQLNSSYNRLSWKGDFAPPSNIAFLPTEVIPSHLGLHLYSLFWLSFSQRGGNYHDRLPKGVFFAGFPRLHQDRADADPMLSVGSTASQASLRRAVISRQKATELHKTHFFVKRKRFSFWGREVQLSPSPNLEVSHFQVFQICLYDLIGSLRMFICKHLLFFGSFFQRGSWTPRNTDQRDQWRPSSHRCSPRVPLSRRRTTRTPTSFDGACTQALRPSAPPAVWICRRRRRPRPHLWQVSLPIQTDLVIAPVIRVGNVWY